MGGWVGGSNGDKANLSLAEIGTGLSLVKCLEEYIFWNNNIFGEMN